MLMSTIQLDRNSETPLYRQLYSALRNAILNGTLRSQTRLPSTRQLAEELNIGRNTVITAFEQLYSEGYLTTQVGSGTRVATIESLDLEGTNHKHPSKTQYNSKSLAIRGQHLEGIRRTTASPRVRAFQPGLPAFDQFPFQLWSRILARHQRQPRFADLGYAHSGGHPSLKLALCEYLAQSRGVVCEPEQIIIVSGAQAALDLASRMLIDPGDEVWLEEPGYPGARGALLAAGAQLVPVPVGPLGLDVSAGESSSPNARLAYVSPSFQYPSGVTLGLEQRLRLLDWARRAQAWILEDDYDSEYRYRGRPISAMQGLDPGGRVVYLGTFSKTLYPSLRIGYLVVPAGLSPAFARALRHTGQSAPVLPQLALAEFIAQGHYSAHLRRMRTLYAQRKTRLTQLLSEYLPDLADFPETDGGMQLPVWLKPGLDAGRISERAFEQNIVAPNLAEFYLGKQPQPGLFLGFAGVAEDEMETAMSRLAEIIRSAVKK